MFKLVISDEEGKTTVVPLVRDEITIGRKEGNTIRLTERNVSRKHAKLRKGKDGFVLQDMGSYNGVRVNGRRIEGETELKTGDQISIGDYLLALQLEGMSANTIGPPKSKETDTDATLKVPALDEMVPPARLVMLSPPSPGAEFALTSPNMKIGRGDDLAIWVNHKSISREHAAIETRDGKIEVADLGSANGVRLNGKPTTRAELKPGDVIEFGQVRFRFVGEGENYVFDSDRTVQLEAVHVEQRSARTQYLVVVGILLSAVVIAVALALSAPEEETRHVIAVEDAPTVLPPVAAQGPTAAEMLARCDQLLTGLDAPSALAAANDGLNVHPGDAPLEACKARAESLLGQSQLFEQAATAQSRGDVSAAHNALSALPEDSPYWTHSTSQQILGQYADSRLQLGRSVLEASPAIALREAQFVAQMRTASPAQKSEAANLERDARRILNRPPEDDRQGAERVSTTEGPGPTKRAPRTTQTSAPQAACDLTDPDYNRCVIRRYGSRQNSAQELAMVIEAYRSMGNQPAALRHMQDFIRRFPTARQTRTYEQILARQTPR